MRTAWQQGFTLVELIVVLAVLAVVAAMAMPAFSDLMVRRRLEGAANELSADLQYARSQAVSASSDVTFATSGTSGYTITGSGSVTYKTVTLGSSLSVNSGVTITFKALRGCTNDSCSADDVSVTVSSPSNSLRATVNRMGRVALCVPSGTFGGYSSCS